MKRLSLALAACLAVTITSAAEPKQRDWKPGTLVAMAEQRETAGAVAQDVGPNVPYAPQMSRARVVYNTWLGCAIHTDTMDYMVRYLLRRNWRGQEQARPNVTVKAPIKFAVEGGKFYLLDDDGKEFEMVVMQKQLPSVPAAEGK